MKTFLLTMQYDEALCLPYFLKHYSRYVDPSHTFVIDHGSSLDLIPAQYNKIRVPRDKPYSELSRLHLIKSLASGLLQYFDAGIYVDCDELIDLDDFMGLDSLASPVNYVAGFDVFWDQLPHGRRLLGYLSPHLCKASIFSITPNWIFGFHGCDHRPRVLTLPMAHIRFLFEEQSSRRLRDRVRVHESMRENERAEGIAAQWADGDTEFREFRKFVTGRRGAQDRIRKFAPIDAELMFQKHVLAGDAGPGENVVYAPNGFSPVADFLFDLTDEFPALA